MEKTVEKIDRTESYHAVLAKSYMVYFLAAIVGIFADLFLPTHFYVPLINSLGVVLAVICFAVGVILIVWAQYTSRHTRLTTATTNHEYFTAGPYLVVRNPTQLGLVLLVAGYSFIMHSLPFLIAIIIAYFVSNMFFKRYEKMLKETYGEKYVDYEKKVMKML